MPAAARQSDMHTCPKVEPGPTPHVGGPIQTGSGDVDIEFLPAARAGDDAGLCQAGGPDTIQQGCGTVSINFKPAARVGDMTAHGGVIVAGAGTVEIGEACDTVTIGPIESGSCAGSPCGSGEGAGREGGSGEGPGEEGGPEGPPTSRETAGDGGVHARIERNGTDDAVYGKPVRFRCTSWDPDHGGTSASPNPSNIVRRSWRFEGEDVLSAYQSGGGLIEWEVTPVGHPDEQKDRLTCKVILDVEDADGHRSTAELSVPLTVSRPECRISVDRPLDRIEYGETVLFTADAHDPDDGVSIGNGIHAYYWLVTDPSGATTVHSSPDIELPVDQPGSYTIELTVTDGEGLEASHTIQFLVTAWIVTLLHYAGNRDWLWDQQDPNFSAFGHMWVGWRFENSSASPAPTEIGFGPKAGYSTGLLSNKDGEIWYGRRKNNEKGHAVTSQDFYVSRAAWERSKRVEHAFPSGDYLVGAYDCVLFGKSAIMAAGMNHPGPSPAHTPVSTYNDIVGMNSNQYPIPRGDLASNP